MNYHSSKIQPLAHFGKLTASLILTFSLLAPLALRADPPAPTQLKGTATIQLKNASSPQNLAGLDLVLAPLSVIPEIRRLRMETWRTSGLAVQRTPDGEEQAVGIKVDFADGYKNLDLKSLGQAAANAATARTRSDSNGVFLFTNATPGKQTLYGQYKSRYAVAYWLLEVDLRAGQTNSLILCQSNAAEVFNRFEKSFAPSK